MTASPRSLVFRECWAQPGQQGSGATNAVAAFADGFAEIAVVAGAAIVVVVAAAAGVACVAVVVGA